MDRERVLGILNSDVKTARRRFHQTEEFLDFAMRPASSSYQTADRQRQLRLAGRSYGVAGNNLQIAIYRLNRLVLEGSVPEDLTVKPPRRENGKSIDFRKSA